MSPFFLLPIVYLAAALQALLSPQWLIAGVGPDLLALSAFTWLAVSTNRFAFISVAFIGLAADLGSPAPLGVGMATFAVVSYLLIRLRSRIHLDHLPGHIAIVCLGVAITCFIQSISLRLLAQTTMPWLMLLPRSLLVGFYTAAIATPLLMIIGWLRSPRRTFELTSG